MPTGHKQDWYRSPLKGSNPDQTALAAEMARNFGGFGRSGMVSPGPTPEPGSEPDKAHPQHDQSVAMHAAAFGINR